MVEVADVFRRFAEDYLNALARDNQGENSYCLTWEYSPKRNCCLIENVLVASCRSPSFSPILLFDRAAGILPPRPQICLATARSGGQ